MRSRTVIHLPNGDAYPATVTWADGWTEIKPDKPIPTPPSEFGESLGDSKDFIHEMSVRGILSPGEAAREVAASWLRDTEWQP